MTGLISLLLYSDDYKEFYSSNSNTLYYWLSVPIIVFIVSNCSLSKFGYHKVVPLNYLIMLLLVISVTFVISSMLVQNDKVETGLWAMIYINAMPFGVWFFTLIRPGGNVRFSFAYELFCSIFFILGTYMTIKYLVGIEDCFMYCMIGAIIFSIYVLLDTWFILRGIDTCLYKVKDGDDYMLAVLAIYTDIIFIYIYMIKALNES